MKYDYVIVGAGLFGATCARLLADAGKSCLVIEKRKEIGGNCHDYEWDGILVGKYGGHIFHTNSKRIWRFVNKFAEWKQYEHRVKARYQGRMYSFPINRLTFDQFGLPINTQTMSVLHEIFFKGYSEKQWGRPITEIPGSIMARVKARTTYDDRYFTDKYQGLPAGGYTRFIEQMFDGIKIELNADFKRNWEYFRSISHKVIFTGKIDEFFKSELGSLEYRSLDFRHLKDTGDYQGCPAVNYADRDIPYTRTVEWKHFHHQRLPYTVFTFEYPRTGTPNNEPYYPVGDERNLGLYRKYKQLADEEDWLLVGGRLGSYKYLNMDQTIGQAMVMVRREFNGC